LTAFHPSANVTFVALNIKNREAEALAAEVARLSGTTLTGAVIEALREQKKRLEARGETSSRAAAARAFLERAVWSKRRPRRRGPSEDELLGFGDSGA
jgi:antitoxin VapB